MLVVICYNVAKIMKVFKISNYFKRKKKKTKQKLANID